MNALLTPQEAPELIKRDTSVVVLDASFGVPDAQGSFMRAHIPGARFFDIEAASDHASPYPHTLPNADDFAAVAGALGIDNNTTLLIYDQNGITFAAARAWWMFRVFGHDNVHVINGGLPAWVAAGLPVENGAAFPHQAKTFVATFQPDLYRSFDDVERASENGSEIILDARPPMRFDGMGHSLDGDVIPTHIPNSTNLPFTNLLDHSGAMKADAEISDILKNHQPSDDKKLILSCGSGVTACVLLLGFFQTGFKNTAVFDGSWAEWSDRQNIR